MITLGRRRVLLRAFDVVNAIGARHAPRVSAGADRAAPSARAGRNQHSRFHAARARIPDYDGVLGAHVRASPRFQDLIRACIPGNQPSALRAARDGRVTP